MKKRLIPMLCLALIVVSTLSATGCKYLLSMSGLGGAGDWEFHLTGPYAIWRINSRDIHLVKETGDGTAVSVVPDYTLAFQYGESAIGLKCLSSPKWDDNASVPVYDEDDAVFYLFLIRGEKLFGPFDSEEAYNEKCDELNADEMCGWITTYPAPKGADFD